jgi:hypothetical protein
VEGWLANALLAWVPIAVAILLASGVRLAFLLGTWDRRLAMVVCLLPSGAIVCWASWLLFRRIGTEFIGVRGRVALLWVGVSAAFRALWIGLALGGGWELVQADYRSSDWQPWPVLLGWIAVCPFLFRSRVPSSPAGSE